MNETSLKQSDFIAAPPNPWRPWVAASIAAVAILGIAIGLMALLHLFDRPQNDTGTKSLAAALGLVGAVLSAVAALVGTIIKYSLDDRNARQADIEASRNYALAVQAEQRNRIEAAIRAVDLLSENNADATKSQMGGALLALVSLGELDLAVSLLAELWPKGKASPQVADGILTAAIRDPSADTQIKAAEVLFKNATRIQQAGYYIWPMKDLGWNVKLAPNAKLGLVLAAAEWLKSGAESQPPILPDAVVVLYRALGDSKPDVSDIAAACLRPVLRAWPDFSAFDPDSGDGQMITAAAIGEVLRKHGDASSTNYGQEYERQLEILFAPLIEKAMQVDASEQTRTNADTPGAA